MLYCIDKPKRFMRVAFISCFKGKILIMLPTFSPFYEYVNKNTTEIHYYPLVKEFPPLLCVKRY